MPLSKRAQTGREAEEGHTHLHWPGTLGPISIEVIQIEGFDVIMKRGRSMSSVLGLRAA